MTTTTKIMNDLVGESTCIISTPETIEKLRKDGVKFDSKTETIEQYATRVYLEKKKLSPEFIKLIPCKPNIAIPTILSLYDEIIECIIFGVNGAAITLSAVLVEYSLKYAINRKVNGETYSQEAWDKLENMDLGKAISKAKSVGVVDNPQYLFLNEFRQEVRNPYLHYNIKKITKNIVAGKVKKFDINTRKVSEENLCAEDNPALWTHAKKFVDKEWVIQVFLFADQLVRDLFVEMKVQ